MSEERPLHINLGGPAGVKRFVHNGINILIGISDSVGRCETYGIIFTGSLEQCLAEISRLNLQAL